MHPRLTLDLGWSDLAAALVRRGDAAAARRSIEAMAPPGAEAVAALSVRTAFDALLCELDLPPGSEVLASGINIEGMGAIVRAHGLILKPVDIAAATLAPRPEMLKAAIGPRSRLFLLAHLFGARVRTDQLAAACCEAGVLFVEDCAQAFAGELRLSPGSDAALYSFGPIKRSTALGGGVAVVGDVALARRLRARLAAYPSLPDSWFVRRLWKYAALKAANSPVAYGLLFAALAALGLDPETVIGSAARGFGSGALIAQIRKQAPDRLLSLLLRRLKQGNDQIRRRERALDIVGRESATPEVPGKELEDHAWWLVPVLIDRPDALVSNLRLHGFDATRGATSLRALQGPDGRPAPECARIMARIVFLPAPRSRRARSRLAGRLHDAHRRADGPGASHPRDEAPAATDIHGHAFAALVESPAGARPPSPFRKTDHA